MPEIEADVEREPSVRASRLTTAAMVTRALNLLTVEENERHARVLERISAAHHAIGVEMREDDRLTRAAMPVREMTDGERAR
jgi:hypothetical protein